MHLQDGRLQGIYDIISEHWAPKRRRSKDSLAEDEDAEEAAEASDDGGDAGAIEYDEEDDGDDDDSMVQALDDDYGDSTSEELRVAEKLGVKTWLLGLMAHHA